MPSAAEVPAVEAHWVVTPSPRNPLGAKGVGEIGMIAAPAAVHAAVLDALALSASATSTCRAPPNPSGARCVPHSGLHELDRVAVGVGADRAERAGDELERADDTVPPLACHRSTTAATSSTQTVA